MPIYEYRCTTCGYQREYLQKVSDPLLTDCPDCGKPTFKKLLSAAGFQLKGNGWYATDFKNNGAKSKDGAKSNDGATSADKDKNGAPEPKKEQKPEPAGGSAATPAST